MSLALFLLLSSVALIAPTLSQAQTTDEEVRYTLLEPLPCIPSPAAKDANGNAIPGTEVACSGATQEDVDFKTYVQYVFNLLIALSAAAAVFMIVWGGFKYTSSDSFTGKNEGKETIIKALQGLLLVLCSYLILRTIDPRLVAIPSTLVTPLELKYDKKAVSEFFTQLAAEADAYKVQTQQLIVEREAAKATVAQLTQRRATVQYDLDAARRNGDTEAVARLEGEIANIDNQLNDTKAVQVQKSAEAIITAMQAINRDLGETSNATTNDLPTVRGAKSAAAKTYASALKKLEEFGSPADKIQDINNIYYPIYGSLVLQENSFPGDPATQLAAVKKMIDEAIPKITDAEKKDALLKKADLVVKDLEYRKNSQINPQDVMLIN
ncbi:MAG: hypothetical protein AAB365_03315 [Patescibacteria group bacterium]